MKSMMTFVLACSGVAVAQEAVQWRVEEAGNGHWYLWQQDTTVGTVCWSEALARSRSVGGDLASLTSAEEEDFVRLMNNCLDAPWIGYQGEGLPWSDGEPVGYTNWLSGQPSGDGPYVTMTCAPSEAGWNDIGGSSGCWPNLNSWVTEWSADCNNDGIVDYGQILDGSLQDYDQDNIPDICEAKQWLEADGGNGHWYLYQQDTAVGSVCWSEALVRSRSVGGDLVSLTSAEEEDFVRLMNDCSNAPWIGYQGGGLPWSDGEPVGYTNWLSGQPSGDGPYATMTCAPSDEGWNDIGGSSGCWPNLNFWVTEWSADCNNDGIVDFGQILTGTLTDSDLNGVPDQCELGACCLNASCVVALSSSCDAAGGQFSGVGSTCGSIVCDPSVDDCPGDITDDGQVDFTDLLIIVSTWGPCSDG